MFLDTGPLGPGWGESPQHHSCKSCNKPILKQHRVEFIQFPASGEAAEMTGRYHAQCAGPFATLAHTLAALERLPFGSWRAS